MMTIMNQKRKYSKDLNYGRAIIDKFCQDITTPIKVLDIGAGYGTDLSIVQKHHPVAQLYAIEAFISFQQNLKDNGITVYGIDIEKGVLPFEDNSIDLIICNQILEHCKEIWWICHEITRVLKPGGTFIIGVPNLASFHNRLLLLIGQQPTCIKNNSAHVRGYTKNDIIKFLNTGFPSGYQLDSFYGSNFYPFPRRIAMLLAKIFPKMAVGIFFKFTKSTKEYNNEFLNYPRSNKLQTNFYVGPPKKPIHED